MNGKTTFKKTFQKTQNAALKNTTSFLEVGNWRLLQNAAGDLIAFNTITSSTTILAIP